MKEDKHSTLSPTVLLVIEKFISKIQIDDDIPSDVTDRLHELLLKGVVPKPEDIYAELFNIKSKTKYDSDKKHTD